MSIEMESFPLKGCFPNDVTIQVEISTYFLMKFSELKDCQHQLHGNLLTLKSSINFLSGTETVKYKFFTVIEYLV